MISAVYLEVNKEKKWKSYIQMSSCIFLWELTHWLFSKCGSTYDYD